MKINSAQAPQNQKQTKIVYYFSHTDLYRSNAVLFFNCMQAIARQMEHAFIGELFSHEFWKQVGMPAL